MLHLKLCLFFILNCYFISMRSAKLIENEQLEIFFKDFDYQNSNSIYDYSMIENILNKLNEVLRFLELNYNEVNVDGLFGIRIAEGVFLNLASKQQNHVNNDLSNIYNRLKVLGEKILNIVIKNTPEYALNFKILIDKPFLLSNKDQKYKKLDFEPLNQIETSELDASFNEQLSDNCYSILLNNYYDSANNCQTNDECLDFYTRSNASGYFLTHQLLFFLMAKDIGCSEKIIHYLTNYLSKQDDSNELKKLVISSQVSLSSNIYLDYTIYEQNSLKNTIYNYYCVKIFNETSKLYELFDETSSFQEDLFIEQILLCGLMKYENFMKTKWFKLISSFQDSINGCFGNKIYNVKHNGKNRHKRADQSMQFGCSSHETGLAIAYYSVLLDYYMKINSNHN